MYRCHRLSYGNSTKNKMTRSSMGAHTPTSRNRLTFGYLSTRAIGNRCSVGLWLDNILLNFSFGIIAVRKKFSSFYCKIYVYIIIIIIISICSFKTSEKLITKKVYYWRHGNTIKYPNVWLKIIWYDIISLKLIIGASILILFIFVILFRCFSTSKQNKKYI